MKHILFLCTGNSCRSQMAEGWAKHLLGDQYLAYSAGIETHGLNPNAVKVMAEAGVDISLQQSQHADTFQNVPLDVVFTVCDHALNSCPAWLGQGTVVSASFDDPPKLAANETTEEAALAHYRRVRDEIKAFVTQIPDMIKPLSEHA